jgi:16S rRNA (cytosine1402-N4)-methyltransferase
MSSDDRSLKQSSSKPQAYSEYASSYHDPVMLREVLESLALIEGGIYVDCTLGGGGYAEAILERIGDGKLYGFDTDPHAMDFAGKRLSKFGDRFEIVPENFASIEHALNARGVNAVDGIVYDLGVSSNQFDTGSIGLSYRVEAKLDMRLDPRLPVSAWQIVNEYSDEELKRIFKRYGEEPFAGPIARKITAARIAKPVETTTELAEIVTKGVREDKKASTLSRIFQALRIEVNQELESLTSSLEQAIRLLRQGGRLVIVSYHSLEDRIVKDLFREQSEPKVEPGSLRSLKESIDLARATLELIERKPVIPSDEEIVLNPRARSAKLRAARKR